MLRCVTFQSSKSSLPVSLSSPPRSAMLTPRAARATSSYCVPVYSVIPRTSIIRGSRRRKSSPLNKRSSPASALIVAPPPKTPPDERPPVWADKFKWLGAVDLKPSAPVIVRSVARAPARLPALFALLNLSSFVPSSSQVIFHSDLDPLVPKRSVTMSRSALISKSSTPENVRK